MKTPHNEEYKCYLPQDQGLALVIVTAYVQLESSLYTYACTTCGCGGVWTSPHKGTKGDEIEEIGEPAERLLDPIFKVGANNKPQCSFKLEVPEYSGKLR